MTENIISAILNMIFVSIPEESVWLLIVLILLKRFDLLDKYMWKQNIKLIMFPIILTALSINIFRYLIVINPLIRFVVFMLVLSISTIYIVKKSSFIEINHLYIKTISFVILGMLIITLSEFLYIPIMLHIIQKPISFINSNILYNFLASIPQRILQIMFICVLYKKYTYSEIKLFSHIFKTKIIAISTTFFMGVILFILASAVKLIGDNNILKDIPLLLQILISISLVIIPTLLIFSYIMPINYLIEEMFRMQQSYNNMIDDETDVYK